MAKGRFGWQAPWEADQASHRRKISEALVPPKPKELESTVSIVLRCALCGTRSMAVATDGLSRLSVGGARSVANGEDPEDRLDRAGSPKQMADRRFGRRHRDLAGGVAEKPLDRGELDLVSHRRRGAVGIDVVDIGGLDPGTLHRRTMQR